MRTLIRTMSAFALGYFLLVAASPVAAGEAGRDFSHCVRACNSARIACVDQCLIDCRALFPQNSTQRGSCMSACTRTCVASESGCKAECRAIKEGGCPSQP